VHIDADALGAIPGARHAEVSHLGTDAGEGGEALDCVGDVAVPVVAEDLGRLLDVSGRV
jgi:hypothetical protein